MPAHAPASVCLFCGAREARDPRHATAATELGAGLARAGVRLVYGAGDSGLMGRAAAAARAADGVTLGVIPAHRLGREVRAAGTGMVVTETMHERKKVMFMNADAIVVLPGGAGTLDEFFEVLTWAQLGLHAKPIVLVNVAGAWDALVALLGSVIDAGYADRALTGHFRAVPDAPAALAALGLEGA